MNLEIIPEEENALQANVSDQNVQVINPTTMDTMMAKAIEMGGVEALEKIIALKEREEDRQASVAFDHHFADMQAEFIPVVKTKETKNSDGSHMYNYAPIEELQKQYGPIISKHGFSYRWEETTIDTGKRCTLIISGWGSSRKNSFDVPTITGTKRMNPIQVVGAMSSYGRRYTFISGFGVIIEEEDTDGIPAGTGAEYADEVLALDSCANMNELMATWTSVLNRVRGDRGGMKYLAGIKDKKKDELRGK